MWDEHRFWLFFFSFTFIPHHGLQRRRRVFSRRVSSPRLVFISYLFYLYKTGEAKYVVVHKKSCLVNKKIQCQIRYDKVTRKSFYYDNTELHNSDSRSVDGKMWVWTEKCECGQKMWVWREGVSVKTIWSVLSLLCTSVSVLEWVCSVGCDSAVSGECPMDV